MKRGFAIPAIFIATAACTPDGRADQSAETGAAADLTEVSAATTPSGRAQDVEALLMRENADYLPVDYAIAWADLNFDGEEEAIVHVTGRWVCGSGGCNTLVLQDRADGWQIVTSFSVSRLPVTMLETTSNGWSDLTVGIGGGGLPAGTAKLAFDGQTYPSNPTVAPTVTAEEAGIPLLNDTSERITIAAPEDASAS